MANPSATPLALRNPDLLDLIACPSCRAKLLAVEAVSLRCTVCARVYPIEDGIPILLIERAQTNPS
jgi:uncharacterized protein